MNWITLNYIDVVDFSLVFILKYFSWFETKLKSEYYNFYKFLNEDLSHNNKKIFSIELLHNWQTIKWLNLKKEYSLPVFNVETVLNWYLFKIINNKRIEINKYYYLIKIINVKSQEENYLKIYYKKDEASFFIDIYDVKIVFKTIQKKLEYIKEEKNNISDNDIKNFLFRIEKNIYKNLYNEYLKWNFEIISAYSKKEKLKEIENKIDKINTWKLDINIIQISYDLERIFWFGMKDNLIKKALNKFSEIDWFTYRYIYDNEQEEEFHNNEYYLLIEEKNLETKEQKIFKIEYEFLESAYYFFNDVYIVKGVEKEVNSFEKFLI